MLSVLIDKATLQSRNLYSKHNQKTTLISAFESSVASTTPEPNGDHQLHHQLPEMSMDSSKIDQHYPSHYAISAADQTSHSFYCDSRPLSI